MSTQLASSPSMSIRKKLTLIDKNSAITQSRLKEFYLLQKEYEEAQRTFAVIQEKFERAREALGLKVIGGAPIKDGTYRPSFKIVKVRHPRYKDALIRAKGKHYQQAVLEETKPTTHLYGWVE